MNTNMIRFMNTNISLIIRDGNALLDLLKSNPTEFKKLRTETHNRANSTKDAGDWQDAGYLRYIQEAYDNDLPMVTRAKFDSNVNIKEEGSHGDFFSGVVAKKEKLESDTNSQLNQVNVFIAQKDYASAQAILDNIKVDNPSYDTSEYQGRVDTGKGEVVTPEGELQGQLDKSLEHGLITQEVYDKAKKYLDSGLTDQASEYFNAEVNIDRTEDIPTYDYSKDPGKETIDQLKAGYQETAAQELGDFVEPEMTDKYEAPTLTPEMVQNWDLTVQDWDKVADTKEEERLLRTLDAQDPYGAGSGDRATKLSALIADRAEARKGRSFTLAQDELSAKTDTAQVEYQQKLTEWEKQYGTAWSQYNYKQQQIENSKLKLQEIAEFESNAFRFTNAQEREAAWASLERAWTQRDQSMSDKQELEMQGRNIAAGTSSQILGNIQSTREADTSFYQNKELMRIQNANEREVAGMYADANKKSAFDYVAPVLSTVASGYFQGFGYSKGSSLLSSKYGATDKTK